MHSLPSPGDGGERRRSLGRWKMLVVMLVCAAPVIASYFTYYVIRPDGRRNFGELIEPQVEVPALSGTDLQGKPLSATSLKGQWLLVSVGGGACTERCQQHLYLQRQLRESLGKDKDRLDWVWLVSDDQPVPDALRPALRDAQVLRLPQADIARWLAPAAGQALDAHLYVVDPMGHWMMRFPPRLDLSSAAKAKRDLERLMRASAGWDKAGR